MSQQQPQWQPTNPPVPPVKQSWFARHKVLSLVLGIVLLVVVICCGAGIASMGGGDSSTSAGTETSETTQQSADASEDEPGEKKEESKEAAPGIGDPVRDGKFEFTVSKVETGVSSVGGQFGETADGQFVLVHISVKNIGDEAQVFFDSEQTVRDAEGRSFSADSAAAIYIDNNDIWLNEVNPGNTAEGILVYDMPADAKPAEIELHDSMFSGGVTVSLQ